MRSFRPIRRTCLAISLGVGSAAIGALLLSGCGGSGGYSATTVPTITLANYTTGVGLTDSDTTVYLNTYSRTLSPDPYKISVSNQTQTITDTGAEASANTLIPRAGASLGTPAPVTILLPDNTEVPVTKQALLDPLGNVEGYEYYVLNSAGETYYGDDTLSKGVVSATTRYVPGVVYPYNLQAGQSKAQTYTDYESTYNSSGAVASTFSYSITSSTTFSTILPSFSVTGGTYSNVAEVQYFSSGTIPAGASGNANIEAVTQTATLDLSQYVGVLEDQDVTTTANELITPTGAGQSPYTTTETDSSTEVLTSASVGGVTYPPGRAVTSITPQPVRLGHLLHLLRIQHR